MKERTRAHVWKAGLIAALLPLAAGSATQGSVPSSGTIARAAAGTDLPPALSLPAPAHSLDIARFEARFEPTCSCRES